MLTKKTRRKSSTNIFQLVPRDDLSRRLIEAIRSEISGWGPDAAQRCAAGADVDLGRLFDACDRVLNFPIFRHITVDELVRRESRP